MLVVSVERNRFLQARRDQTHAELLLPSQIPREGSLQRLWKEYLTHDEDQQVVGRQREKAGEITIVRTEGPVPYSEVTYHTALSCGFKTTQALQENWVVIHPRSQELGIVWFVLGDWRDRDLFMSWTGRGGSDFTSNPSRSLDPDAPVPEEIAENYAYQGRQRDEARRAAASLAMATETPSERLKRLQRYIEHLRVTVGEEAARQASSAIRQHIRVVEQRVKRAEGRKNGT